MRRSDFFLVLILVVLVLILVIGVVLRPQPAAQQVAAGPTPASLEGRLAAAQANVEALQGQLALPTAVPGSIDLSEWETLTGNGVSVALPSHYEGGEVSQELIDSIVAMMPDLAASIEGYVQLDPNLIRFFAFDVAEFVGANVNVVYIPLESDLSIEQAADGLLSQFPAGMTLLRNDFVNFQDMTALRLDIENTLIPNTPTMRQLQYSFITGNAIWTLTYSAMSGDFAEVLPIFEISARSFAITG